MAVAAEVAPKSSTHPVRLSAVICITRNKFYKTMKISNMFYFITPFPSLARRWSLGLSRNLFSLPQSLLSAHWTLASHAEQRAKSANNTLWLRSKRAFVNASNHFVFQPFLWLTRMRDMALKGTPWMELFLAMNTIAFRSKGHLK